MKHLYTKIAGFALLACTFGSASASLLSPQEYNDGTNIWLKIAETTNVSLVEIDAGWSPWSANYRIAEKQEIDRLLASFGIVTTDYSLNPPARIGQFIHQLGGGTYGEGTSLIDGNVGLFANGRNVKVSMGITNGENSTPINENCPAFRSCSYARVLYSDTTDWFAKSDGMGLFVVRRAEVPEPTSLSLIAIAAVAGLSTRRRKKKN